MHPLRAAQATVVSLHALLPQHQPTSPDERLLVDAIIALRQWAIPDRRPVPTRLRLHPAIPLQIRVKSPGSQPASVVKRRRRRSLRSARGRRSNLSHTESSPSRLARLSRTEQPSSARDSVAESTSQPPPLSISGSQVVNNSDLSTEPPEGWPKLTDVSSLGVEHRSALQEPRKDLHRVGKRSGTSAVTKRRKRSNDAKSPFLIRQSVEEASGEETPLIAFNAAPPPKSIAKRRRVSPRTSRAVGDTEQVKSDSGPASTSPDSTRSVDSPGDSQNTKEPDRDHDGLVQRGSVLKECSRKRKSSAPKRRRPSSRHQSPGPLFIAEGEKGDLGETTGFAASPPPDFDDNSPARMRSVKSAHIDRNMESPAVSVTQKSKEQDSDSNSDKRGDRTHSPGSVVVGSSSYDGRSVDMGYERNRSEQDDIPSRPSSVVWNESNVETIDEPPTGDQSVPLPDTIEETENLPQSEFRHSAKKSQYSESPLDNAESNATPHVARQGRHAVKGSPSHELVTPATPRKDRERLILSESKNSCTNPSLPDPGKYRDPSNPQVSTPLVSGKKRPDFDGTNANRQLPSRTSPVSLEEPPTDSEKLLGTQQQDKLSCPSQTSIDEMVVCIGNFTNELESELAHEIVMRLGGEIVSDFESGQPECVVAPVDTETQEVVRREMVIHFALASGVPVVGLAWLTQCFKSGCWVDYKAFETPSSRLKPSPGVFTGVAAIFEDAFSRKNAKKQCREYRDGVSKLIVLAGGVVIDRSKLAGVTQNDKSIKLHIQIAYDFDNGCLSGAPQAVPGKGVSTCVVNKSWISDCLFSGQCPPAVR